jgi:thiol-disulfide isomerase/thioredoxin
MSNFFSSHNSAFRAEWLKLKRSGIFWLCMGTAAFIPIITTIAYIFINNNDPVSDAWQTLIKNNLENFTGFFFPLFLVITTVRIVYMEHRSDTWKLMETQPVSRLSLYLVKYEVAILVSLLSLICLFLFSLVSGVIVTFARPTANFSKSSIDWGHSLSLLLRYWVSSFGIIAVIYFFALLIKSFAWPMIIGLIAIIVGSMLAGFHVLTWFPFAALVLTSASYNGGSAGSFLLYHERLSILWTALFLVLGYILYTRRGFVKAFFSPVKQLVQFILCLIIFGGIFWLINKPVVLNRYTKTILAGQVESEIPVRNVILARYPAYDTIFSIPVVNGKFKIVSGQPLEKGLYALKAGDFRGEIYFGGNDSLYLTIKADKNKQSIEFGGTRIAENDFIQTSPRGFFFLENYAYTYSPERYASSLMDEWKSGVKKINNFKTADNVKPGEDFLSFQKKILAVRLLQLADILYPQGYSVYHPNDSLKFPSYINNLRSEVKLNDSSLITSSVFLDYISALYHSKSKATKNRDSSFFTSVFALPSRGVREAVLYKEIESRAMLFTDSLRRSAFLQMAAPYIQGGNYQSAILGLMNKVANLQRGKKATDISTESLNEKDFQLSDLRGRYVVIDVWATWCGPCRRESPHFEEYADRYTNEDIAFVSISIDDDKKAWKMDAYGKSQKVLQLWSKNGGAELSKYYALATIPRFMLIDPKGNIVNAQLPPPSDPEFDNILRREIPSLRDID